MDELPVRHKILDFVRLRGPAGTKDRGWELTGIEEFSHFAEGHGWTPLWHHVFDRGPGETEKVVEKLSHSNGVIIFYLAPPELPWMLYLYKVPVLTVFSTRGGLGEKPQCYPQLSYDRQQSATMAVEHLLSLGYRRIGYIGETSHSQARMAGFVDVIRRHNLPIQAEWILQFDYPVRDLNRVHLQVRRALKKEKCPDAYCCSTKDVARAAWAVAEDLGLKVPQDLALIACDEGEPDVPGHPGITTVAYSIEETFAKALELMSSLRDTNGSDKSVLWEPIMMPLHLTVRESCGAKLRGADVQVVTGES